MALNPHLQLTQLVQPYPCSTGVAHSSKLLLLGDFLVVVVVQKQKAALGIRGSCHFLTFHSDETMEAVCLMVPSLSADSLSST